MAQLSDCFVSGDFSDWPLDQSTVCELVRVRLVRAQKDPKKQYKELRVRSRVVKLMAKVYMDSYIQDLGRRGKVLKLTKVDGADDADKNVVNESSQSLRTRLAKHIEDRVDQEYPAEKFGNEDGAIPNQILEMLEAGDTNADQETAFEMKQATMPDMATSGDNVFQGVRPTLVVDEGETRGTFSEPVITDVAMRDKTNIMNISTSNVFENQFVSYYNCRVFPWALNYDCGGPDYPDLFADWDWLQNNLDKTGSTEARSGWRDRWRRTLPLLPGEYAKMLATRPEMQLAGDWMCVPAARNLHWRYAVLHSAFLVCRQKVGTGESLHDNLDKLLASLEKYGTR